MTHRLAIGLLVALSLIGCETAPPASSRPATPPASGATAVPTSRPLAYVNGRAVTEQELQDALIEAAGGEVLNERILDQMIRERLAQRGLSVTSDLTAQERANVLATLSNDPDEAAKLLESMRAQRGLGEQRFESMLFRNAGLRLLVQDQVEVSPALVRQAYELQHGERYRVRIIVAQTMAQASELLTRAKAGESFSDLAAMHSTDVSAAQGGLLSPISPVDATYPNALRQALQGMAPGGVSDLLAVDDRFIIMKLEAKLPADPINFQVARPELENQVRREAEAQRMQQAARSLLAEATVVVLDPALNKSWRSRQQDIASE